MEAEYFRQCSICKKALPFEREYYECSVSTCNRKKTGLFFCSVECWDAHVPMMRHRDAWAVKARAPNRADWERQQAAEAAEEQEETSTMSGRSSEPPRPVRRVVGATSEDAASDEDSSDVLVVVSKLKKHIRARSGMNTSDSVVGVLSDHLRALANEAIRNAARDGRKTVLDRDFAPLLKRETSRE